AGANCDTLDLGGSCFIKFADIGGGNVRVQDTCSYPSAQPNSDPSDCVLANTGQCVPSPEICNGLDDNCNGQIDEGVSCDDGNACTVDSCSNAACSNVGSNCDDGNPCTTDSCDAIAGCGHTNNSNPCNDGSACTTNDTCSGGACVGGPPPNCDDGNVCT